MPAPDPARQRIPRRHLPYLDGIRGAAALYVAAYHAVGDVPPPARPLQILAWPLQFGHYAVGVFIVLSGYCLMLPVVCSADARLAGGVKGFLVRRARRILPAYYVVLAAAIAAVALARPHFATAGGEVADALRLTPATVLSHLFLTHNLNAWSSSAFDPPMWSVAAECQIYFAFALVLLPAWRRFGIGPVVALAAALGMAPHLLLPAQVNFDWTCPWYLTLFAMGMAAACAGRTVKRRDARWTAWLTWRWMGRICTVSLAALLIMRPQPPRAWLWPSDLLLGVAAACALARLAAAETEGAGESRPARVAALLQRPALLRLGFCSYSLYLVHAPAIWVVSLLCGLFTNDLNIVFVVRLTIGLALAIALSAGLYCFVERPFLGSGRLSPLSALRFVSSR